LRYSLGKGALLAHLFIHYTSRFDFQARQRRGETVSITTATQAHIAYELIDDTSPGIVAIEFLSREIAGPLHAHEVGEQLDSLIRPDLPGNFVIDFGNVRSLGSTAFSEIVSFAHKVNRLYVCGMDGNLRLGASLIGLDDCAEFAASRRSAVNAARRYAMRGEDDTVDYPGSWVVFN
jgi:anti-anti-sigma regulatory factor